MKRLFYWSASQPGNKLPPDALVLEKSIKEGPLYVGRLCDRDGVGKITTSKQGDISPQAWMSGDDKKLKKIEVLCGSPNAVFWHVREEFENIPLLNAGHALQGYSSQEEVHITKRTIRRENGNEDVFYEPCVKESGRLLCTVEFIRRLVYYFKPIVAAGGESEGSVEMKVPIKSGYFGLKIDDEKIRKYSRRASAVFDDLITSSNFKVSAQERSAVSAIYDLEMTASTIEHQIKVNLSKPCYMYQAEVLVETHYGVSFKLKSGTIIHSSIPMEQAIFEVDGPF